MTDLEPRRGPGRIEAWPLPPTLTIDIAPGPAPPDAAPDSDVGREWARQRAANPRLFSGPILSVVTLDPGVGHLACRRDNYQRLAVQPRVRTGVRLLAVTGVLMAHDEKGEPHVLLGRRSPQTRIYGGQWELGPSGGVSPPAAPILRLTHDDLATHLADEIAEEVGLSIRGARAVGVVRDHDACSDDVSFLVDLGGMPNAGPANWEYTHTRWVAVRDLPALVRDEGATIIDATRALMALLGWLPGPG